MNFPTKISEVLIRVQNINPKKYAATRNYKNGHVSYLSPYISRGFISTKKIYNAIIKTNLPWYECEKFIQELAWRDYFQQVWIDKSEKINLDIKNIQYPINNYQISKAIVEAKTGISAIDQEIKNLYKYGYVHNHMRMYIASVCCNISNSHWLHPSKWMYYNLLDGDLASNNLSWQWVAGSFSNKKYYANQENINKFFQSSQKNTFLDIDYSEFKNLTIPKSISKFVKYDLNFVIPDIVNDKIQNHQKTLIYNYYNIDPFWYENENFQRIFLIEPSIFRRYPVSNKCLNFAIELSKNIKNIKFFVGEFEDLIHEINSDFIIYKEHPLNNHYKGKKESREFIGSTSGYYSSFFSFWKKLKKEIKS